MQALSLSLQLCDVGWFRDKGQFQDRNYIPNPGDLIFSIGHPMARMEKKTM